MRLHEPFFDDDLGELDDRLLSKAARVVAMEDMVAGDRAPNVIALRHDCDNRQSLRTAVKMARWEHERGYRSTYYILHTSPYWDAPDFEELLERIAGFGHEIGIHSNALAQSLRTGEDPDLILERAIERLRGLGYQVRGVAGHGDRFCNRYKAPGELDFANDEQFLECRRESYGEPDRVITRGKISRRLAPRPLADFDLEYEALWAAYPFPWRYSDSGGRWRDPGFDHVADRFAGQTTTTKPPEATLERRQLNLLVHPDWWANAFTSQMATVAA